MILKYLAGLPSGKIFYYRILAEKAGKSWSEVSSFSGNFEFGKDSLAGGICYFGWTLPISMQMGSK